MDVDLPSDSNEVTQTLQYAIKVEEVAAADPVRHEVADADTPQSVNGYTSHHSGSPAYSGAYVEVAGVPAVELEETFDEVAGTRHTVRLPASNDDTA